MRLLFVSHSLPPPGRPLDNLGGMQRLASGQHAALAAHPQVELHSLVLRSSWRWTHLRFVPFAMSLLHRIPRIAERERIDVVLFSSMVTAALAVPLHKRLWRAGSLVAAIPIGRDVTLPTGAYQRFLPRVFGVLNLMLPISSATAAECIRRGADPERVRVIPCGIDTERFPPLVRREAMRAELLAAAGDSEPALPPGALLIASVGRHVERKGFGWFVERVMPLLPADVHFWLAGDGPETPAIRAAIVRHGLRGRVRLLGRIPDETLLKLLRGAGLFVMPNIHIAGDIEGFGVVMLEAGMCGLPTIAAGIEGIRDAIHDGRNGVLVPSGDPEAFAAAILGFHEDRAALAAASERARSFTKSAFAWPVIAGQYVHALAGASAAAASRMSG